VGLRYTLRYAEFSWILGLIWLGSGWVAAVGSLEMGQDVGGVVVGGGG